MKDENVDTIRRWFSALAEGDPAPEMCDPEIEIRNWAESPIPGPYFGHDGLAQWWSDVAEAFDDVSMQLKDIEAIDEYRCLTVSAWSGASVRPASWWTAPGARSSRSGGERS